MNILSHIVKQRGYIKGGKQKMNLVSTVITWEEEKDINGKKFLITIQENISHKHDNYYCSVIIDKITPNGHISSADFFLTEVSALYNYFKEYLPDIIINKIESELNDENKDTNYLVNIIGSGLINYYRNLITKINK